MSRGTVIVSGAANGIGRATVNAFVAANWDCVAVDRDADGLRRLEQELAHENSRVCTVEMDLIKAERIELRDLGICHFANDRLALVNNLGGSHSGPTTLEEMDWETFQVVYDLNLKPTFHLTRACLPAMKRARWGRIVNVSSVAGRAAFSFIGADYCAAKSAVLGLTRKVAQELVSDGILVNAVCPGIIATRRIRERWEQRSSERNREILAQIPLGDLGSANAVARSIYHLASDENTYVTGAVLDINGGLYLA